MPLKNETKRMIYTMAVTLVVVFSTTFAILMTLERRDYRNYLQGEYSKNMYELINSVENIEDNLSKVAVAGTKEQNIIIFEEIFRYAATASDKLHSLPVPTETIGDTSRFLSQVGDFCHSLVVSTREGKSITDEQYNTIDNLTEQSFSLKEDLVNIVQQVNQGRVSWGEIRKKVTGVLAKEDENLVSEKFKNIQKQVAQYPALIYDGPFSDNVIEIQPRVNSEKEVSVEDAKRVVEDIIGKDRIDKIEEKGSESNTRIDSYGFNVTLKNRDKGENVVCDISKRGGKIVYLLDNKKMNRPAIDMEKATKVGEEFLTRVGYKNMVPTYFLQYEDTAVISYIYNVEGVVVYPDQVKLKVSLDDGSIIGVEADKYLVSHTDNRAIPNIKVAADVGREKIGKRVEITNIRLAIIPTETNNEILCYEYSGNYKENLYKIYINAVSGEPERILKIINTPNGQLAI